MKKKYIPLFFIFVILFLSLVSASFNSIGTQYMIHNDFKSINLGYYCSTCDYTSYGIQFTNPDTGQSVYLFPGTSSNNSYFSIYLSNYGGISITSKSKDLNTIITVYGADDPYSSQYTKYFTLDIATTQAPVQIFSFNSLQLSGNESYTYDMNNIFLDYNNIQVSFNDGGSTHLLQSSCYYGNISVCLTGNYNRFLTITGTNQSYSGSFQIIASNLYGTTYSPSFPVVVGISTTFTATPYSKPFTPGIDFLKPEIEHSVYNGMWSNESGTTWNTYSISDFYGNYSNMGIEYTIYNFSPSPGGPYSNMTFRLIGNGSIVYNGTFVNGTARPARWTTTSKTAYATIVENDTLIFSWSWISDNNNVSISIGATDTNYYKDFRLLACNLVGCNDVDDFGNPKVLLINFTRQLPQALPISIAPMYIDLNSQKSYDMNQFFTDWDNITASWNNSDGTSFSVTTPASGTNSVTDPSNASFGLTYKVSMLYNGIINVQSYNTATNFTVHLLACNSAGCVNGTTLTEHKFDVRIFNQSGGQLNTDIIKNTFWNNIYNSFISLFPDSSYLNSQQKAGFVIMVFFVITALVFTVGLMGGAEVMPLLVISGGLDTVTAFFLIAKGYIPVTILAVLAGVVGIIMLIKYLGGRE